MAVSIVPPQHEEPMPAITEHYIETGWKESGLTLGVYNRLASVERCVSAMVAINRMLMEDQLGKNDVTDNDGVVFDRALSHGEVEGLRLALQELGDSASRNLDQIRCRAYVTLAAEKKS